MELWVDGEQVLFDPGTYSYKPKPGEPDYSETQWHNMPWPEGEQQMTRLGRFLWGDWPEVSLITAPDAGGLRLAIWAPTRTLAARRVVRAFADQPFTITDTTSDEGHDACTRSGPSLPHGRPARSSYMRTENGGQRT